MVSAPTTPKHQRTMTPPKAKRPEGPARGPRGAESRSAEPSDRGPEKSAPRTRRNSTPPPKSTNYTSNESREVIYPEVQTQLGVIDVEKAKALLGWTEESENVKFNDEFLLKTPGDDGVKVRCTNNVINRPLYMSIVRTLTQEILRGRWRLNGEPIIVGRTGLILNGQHTLIALILAAIEWSKSQGKWGDFWPEEPTIEKLVVFGIEETDEVVNTLDTAKPRSLADVIFRSEIFADVHRRDRTKLSKMLDFGIRFAWSRTGAGSDAYAPKMTFSEALDFLHRHPRMKDCVKHIYEENGTNNSIGKYLTPGASSGLMYLFAASATDEDGPYHVSSSPSEEMIDMSRWEKAAAFFVELAGGSPKMDEVRRAIGAMMEEQEASQAARVAVLIKAWGSYVLGRPIKAKDLALEYTNDDDGLPVLTDSPYAGGIDLGDAPK